MTFNSNFPDFPADEVAPSETDFNPDIEHKFGRTLSRIMAASPLQRMFMFLRGDFSGRLHTVDAPTHFENIRAVSMPTVVGFVTLSPRVPHRQKAFIYSIAATSKDIYVKIAGISRFITDIQPNELIEMTGFIDEIQISATVADGNVRILEF